MNPEVRPKFIEKLTNRINLCRSTQALKGDPMLITTFPDNIIPEFGNLGQAETLRRQIFDCLGTLCHGKTNEAHVGSMGISLESIPELKILTLPSAIRSLLFAERRIHGSQLFVDINFCGDGDTEESTLHKAMVRVMTADYLGNPRTGFIIRTDIMAFDKIHYAFDYDPNISPSKVFLNMEWYCRDLNDPRGMKCLQLNQGLQVVRFVSSLM
jgi:hypothetical protein